MGFEFNNPTKNSHRPQPPNHMVACGLCQKGRCQVLFVVRFPFNASLVPPLRTHSGFKLAKGEHFAPVAKKIIQRTKIHRNLFREAGEKLPPPTFRNDNFWKFLWWIIVDLCGSNFGRPHTVFDLRCFSWCHSRSPHKANRVWSLKCVRLSKMSTECGEMLIKRFIKIGKATVRNRCASLVQVHHFCSGIGLCDGGGIVKCNMCGWCGWDYLR